MIHALLQGGWVMVPLLACSLLAVAVVVERALYFRRLGRPERADALLAAVREGRADEIAGAIGAEAPPLLRVLAAGLAHRAAPEKAMEAAGLAEVAAMRRGLGILETIITLSPLLGLLGTILGMMGSFQLMSAAGLGEPHAVTGGVAEALVATATGIGVAVAALVPFNYFQGRIERETSRLEQYGRELELVLGGAGGAGR